MFRSFRTPVLFDTPDDGGAGAPAAVADPAPAAEPTTEVTEPAVAEGTTVTEPAPVEAPDWAAKVEEWGGTDIIENAIGIHRALQTREGVEALLYEAGGALHIGEDALRKLLYPEAPAAEGEGEETVEQLLADPERVLTAGEVIRIQQHFANQQSEAQLQARQLADARATLDTTLAKLEVPEPDHGLVLAMADQILGSPTMDPAKISSAITQAWTTLQERTKANAEQYVQSKHEAHEGLPSPLPAGETSGGEPVAPPKSLEEAKARVRKSLGLS